MSVKSAAYEKPKSRPGIFSTGFALFSMFFGAGNLIFPLIIGKTSGNQTPAALFGLTISAVAFPLLGLIAMMFYQGNLRKFLERLGKGPSFCLLLVLMLAQGPLCMSRLFTLMYASISPYLSMSLFIFSILSAVAVFLLTCRPQKIIAILGTILTPFFVISLIFLMGVGMIHAPAPAVAVEGAGFHFLQGLQGGYMTMDLISALLFATMILPHLSQGLELLSPEEAKREVRRKMIGASLIAALFLTFFYLGLCYLSAHHSPSLSASIPPEGLLHAIAIKILGPWGGMVAAIAVFFACLTTAIALAAVFANYIREDLFKEKISSPVSFAITLGLTAALTNLGFSGLLRVMGPILEILYPSLIILCLCNIGYSLYKTKPLKGPVFFALGLAVVGFFLKG